ncbi:DNA/RNA non-specific endonuclease [Streptomyces sp. NPDC086787]|uniref:DNA/RNA non-specific endonuclease n=1 Tax=Streptomyces sp. NPDC086787 TaxID=3365759 RepID=UPI00380C4AEF
MPTRHTVNNCHLLGNQLSGSGTDLRNLATCGRDANDYVKSGGGMGAMDNMKKFENEVQTLITNGGYTVGYTVVPVYKGRRTVPQSFEMAAVLWDAAGNYEGTMKTSVPNLMSSPQGRKNSGHRDRLQRQEGRSDELTASYARYTSPSAGTRVRGLRRAPPV